MDKQPLIIIIITIVILGIALGPMKNKNLSLVKNTGSSSLSSPAPKTTGATQQKSIEDSLKEAEKKVENLQKQVNKQIEESKHSPYYGKIRVSSSIVGLKQNDPSKEYISLYTNLKTGEKINITGWYLQSEMTGYFATIGKAALLPFPFTKSESDIMLQAGDKVYLTKGFSPIGISFRTNACTGYFEENRTFYPSLALACPRASEESLPKFSQDLDRQEECVNLIKRISRCTTKGNEYLRDLPDTVTSSCKNYISTQINYNSCVSHHVGDTSFPGHEYRVYLNKFGPLWRTTHDTIHLLDRDGLIVVTIKY